MAIWQFVHQIDNDLKSLKYLKLFDKNKIRLAGLTSQGVLFVDYNHGNNIINKHTMTWEKKTLPKPQRKLNPR